MDLKNVNIVNIANSLGLIYKRKSVGQSVYYKCPFCSDTTGHLNLRYDKNIWRCNRCNQSGGLISLVMKVNNVDKYAASKYLKDTENSNFVESKYKVSVDKVYETDNVAPEEEVDNTYRNLLNLLNLSDKHRQDLKNRGLNDIEIDNCQFKTVPEQRNFSIAKKLLKMGCVLKGVPGFYTINGRWTINAYPSGFLVPFYNYKHLITGMQIRNDNPSPKKHDKYMSFSSAGKANGTRSKIEPHCINVELGTKKIFLTEGALKADIAYFLTRKVYHEKTAMIAIPGVNNTSSLIKLLKKCKKAGTTTIVNCFDMDRAGNKNVSKNSHVAEGVEKIKTICVDMGFEWKEWSWSTEKGIDDYLLLKYKQEKNS